MLPKIAFPTFPIKIPSTGTESMFRPFVAREEKIFLMAKVSGAERDMLESIKTVTKACAVSDTFSVDALTLTDLEFVFLRLVAMSIDNVVELKYRDQEDEEVRKFDVNLSDVPVVGGEDSKALSKVKVAENIWVQLRPPTAAVTRVLDGSNVGDITLAVVGECIEKVWEGEKVFYTKDATPKELTEFVESLPAKAMKGIRAYVESLPRLYHKLEWTNKKGTARVVELTKLSDFFTLV